MNKPKTLKRLMLWNIGLMILLLVDEYIKEGYFIKMSDFLKPLTHENLFSVGLAFLCLIISIYLKEKKKEKKREI